ncbi:polyprenol phosphomannose-dependent alpha 1,6 mannosyltransferase MptB [Streptomyces aquilus]|uniref:polyprenol phosphomannose-dependent alpha 1,6 mannosyltransferase MptB n=1 Tax=Streptomyces aquilus TaxID=2548456 RepID=UPI0036CA4C5A
MVDLRRCQILGLAGTTVLAAGGETAGALPVRDLLNPASVHAAVGLVGVYFGVVLLIAAWALLGRLIRTSAPPTPRDLLLALALWAAPLLLAPPLFSRDVYSYLAQGAMVDAHMDVYAHGPAQLGGPLADEVAPIWRHTGAPYGPVFLAVAAALAGLTRGELPAGLFAMRLVALSGVALMAAALPRLARHSGADPAAALWLGALNPLVLLHLVAGAHNDAIMLGLLGAGLVAVLGRVAQVPPAERRLARSPRGGTPIAAPGESPRTTSTRASARHAESTLPHPRTELCPARAGGAPMTPLGPPSGRTTALSQHALCRWPVVGTVLVTLAALVKAPAVLGLAAVVVLQTRTGRRPAKAVVTTALAAAATTVVATAVAGTGYGWIRALSTPVSPQNWALTSLLGRATGALLEHLGSDLAPLAVPVWHALGVALTAGLVAAIWWRLRPRPVYALGLSLAAVAAFGPAIRPWYALWGLFLIAAAAPTASVRHRVAAVTGVLALATLPSGGPADAGQLVLAVSGGVLAVVVLWQAHQTDRAPAWGRTA